MAATTFVQSRARMALVVLGCLAFLPVALMLINDRKGTSRYSPEHLHLVGAAGLALFGAFALFGLAQLFRPARLVLEPEGLTYIWLWRRRTWAWREVGPFTVEEATRRVRTICFDAPSRRAGRRSRQTIAAGWKVAIDRVCEELNAARSRWA